jgi:hypothetical protein
MKKFYTTDAEKAEKELKDEKLRTAKERLPALKPQKQAHSSPPQTEEKQSNTHSPEVKQQHDQVTPSAKNVGAPSATDLAGSQSLTLQGSAIFPQPRRSSSTLKSQSSFATLESQGSSKFTKEHFLRSAKEGKGGGRSD